MGFRTQAVDMTVQLHCERPFSSITWLTTRRRVEAKQKMKIAINDRVHWLVLCYIRVTLQMGNAFLLR